MSEKKKVSLKMGVLSAVGLAYLGVSSYAVLALFTDTATVDANTFTTGTIDLTQAPVTAAIGFANMAPGDATAGAITVTNSGTLPLRYAVTSATTEDVLAAQLDLSVRIEASAAACSSSSTGVPILYGPGDLGSTAVVPVIGNTTQGNQAGDRILAAGASEVLCFQARLPITTSNAFQGLTTTATFAFQAEQVANNP